MTTLISAIIVLSILILFHEMGHFTVAKLVGIKVHEFSIGMGPQLIKHRKGETTYSLRILPIGGYVKMEGEDENSTDERAFNNQPIWARILVLIAGVFMNFVLGLLIFVVIFSQIKEIPRPIVDEIIQDSPAQKAGMLPGDKIIKLNNYKIKIQKDIFLFLDRNQGKDITVTVVRSGEKFTLSLTPKYDEEEQRYMIGYKPKFVISSFGDCMTNAWYETVFLSKAILSSLGDLITGKAGFNQMSGPVGIVREIGNAAQAGILSLLYLAALISINLGVFNLLPIPALDGSRILFLVVEAVRGKPINPEKEGIVHLIGFAMLMLLLIFATFNDITKLIK